MTEFQLPTGPVAYGQCSAALWSYLLLSGWERHPDDTENRLYPPGYDGPAVTSEYYNMPTGPLRIADIPEPFWRWLTGTKGWVYKPDARGDYIIPNNYTGTLPVTAFQNYVLPASPTPSWRINEELRDYLVTQGWNIRGTSSWVYTGAWMAADSMAYRATEVAQIQPTSATIPANSKNNIYGSWRIIAQRATTGEYLDMDLPLHVEEITWELNGPGALRGTISPDVGAMRAADGRLLLEEWGTLIFAEADGQIRWGGIVINSTFEGPSWTVEAAGFTAYPHGAPYAGLYSATGVDPAQAFAHIWSHLQSYPDGDLGVVVTGAYTGDKIGLPSGPTLRGMISDQLWDWLIKNRKWWVYNGSSRGEMILPPDYDGDLPPRDDDLDNPYDPYELLWWEAPDCGDELNNLADVAPFDYVEQHAWADATSKNMRHEVQIKFPRAGRRREDLAFIQGENVTSTVSPTVNGDDFSNEILGMGAGEGQGAIRRSTAVSDGRLRRPVVLVAKDVDDATRLDTILAAQLRARQQPLSITEIEVRNHPNAPIGSWAVGDDILVQATIPWLGDVNLWCRIVSWTLTSETTATLQLQRSDSFVYAYDDVEVVGADQGPTTDDGEPLYPGNDTYPSETTYPHDERS